MINNFHKTVLLNSSVDSLNIVTNGIYIDMTLGYGGHSALILKRLGPDGKVIGIDQDEDAINYCTVKFQNDTRVILIKNNFCNLPVILKKLNISHVDGILMDLGVSSPQLDNSDRGFSYKQDGPLDMRMDPSKGKTAADFINHSSLAELIDIFTKYGELSPGLSRKVALKVIQSRPINTTMALAETVKTVLPRRGRIHPEARVFQAVRIAVNDELNIIEKTLPLLPDLLNPGGRVAIITFHSLEDRLVKSYFKEASEYGEESKLEIITKSPITPESLELGINPRARSAKLRVAKRV